MVLCHPRFIIADSSANKEDGAAADTRQLRTGICEMGIR